jgi:hypothetical protein
MKKLLLFGIIAMAVFYASCGDTKKEEVVIPPGMKQVDITIAGNTLTILAPDSTTGPLQVINQPNGSTEITVGNNFQISIEEGEGDIALLKSDIESDDVYKLQKYLKDEPNSLFWEV